MTNSTKAYPEPPTRRVVLPPFFESSVLYFLACNEAVTGRPPNRHVIRRAVLCAMANGIRVPRKEGGTR